MNKAVQVIVRTGNEETNQVHDVVQGKPTYIKAVQGARYQLKDLANKDTGPELIRSKRVGKNLHIGLEGSREADLIIEGYYDSGMADGSGLYGVASDGQVYEYIPEDPTPAGLSANLTDGGLPVSQVLGGNPVDGAFVLSGLPLAALAGGGLGLGGLLAGGAFLAAAVAIRNDKGVPPSGQTGGLDIASDSGTSNTDGITNINTPAITGKAEAGATVEVTLNGKTYSTVADASGNYKIVIPADQPLPDGTYTPKIKVTNASGSTVVDGTPFTIDTSTVKNQPNNSIDTNADSGVVVNITSIQDGTNSSNELASNDTGSSSTDFITNDPTLVIKGTVANFTSTGATAGDKLWVTITNASGVVVATQYITPDAQGNWRLDNTANILADGKYNVKAAIVDAAGNVVNTGSSHALVVDTNKGGTNPSSNPNSTDTTGSNAAANVTVAITTIDDVANGSADTGFSNNDFVTSDGTLIIKGTVANFSTTGAAVGDQMRVQIVDAAGNVVAQKLVSPTAGTWSFDNKATALADGNYTIKAAIVDAAGNVVKAAPDQPLVISSTVPPTSATLGISSISDDTGVSVIDFVTSDATLKVNGVAGGFDSTTSKLKVQILQTNGTTVVVENANVTVNPNGTWTWDNTAVTLPDGKYVIRSVITNIAGVETTTVKTQALVVDHSANLNPNNTPATDGTDTNVNASVAISTIDDRPNGSFDSGNSATDFVTNDPTLIIKGTVGSTFSTTGGSAGDVVLVKITNALGVVVAQQYVLPVNGTWALNNTANSLADGTYTISADIVDMAGNLVKAGPTQALVVDTHNGGGSTTVAAADTATATEAGGVANGTAGTNPIGNVLTNDTGSSLSVQDIKAGNGTATAVVASTTSATGTSVAGSFGTLKIGADGTYTYVVDQANATVQALKPTSTALSDVFTYTVKDAAGQTSTSTITVAVNGANDAPVAATIASQAATIGSTFSFIAPAFTDLEGDALTYSASGLPSWLSFNASTHSFSGTPSTGATGGTITLTANDGSLSTSSTFAIGIGSTPTPTPTPAANAAPVASPTSVANALTQSVTPTVAITDNQSAGYVANGTAVTFTLKFNKPITASSLTASDLKLTGQDTTFASVLTQVDSTTWTYTAKAAATGSAPLVLSMADGAYTSTTGEVGLGGSDLQGVGTAPAPVPGTSTQVNTKSLGFMYSFGNAIETLSDGGWVEVYFASGYSTTTGTLAQRYNADGSKNGNELLVVPNTTASTVGGDATVTALPNGGFVVASSDSSNTYYRIYDASGTPSSATAFKLTGKSGADVLALNDGTFVMTLTNAAGGQSGNFLYHFDSAGAQIGSAVSIDSAASPVVGGWLTKLAGGNFVYTWPALTSGTGGTQDIYTQLFDATGAKVGNPTLTNTTLANAQSEPSVADLENGGYVVSWMSGSVGNSIVMRLFDASGNAVSGEITVASATSGSQKVLNASVEGLVGGGFVVTYENTADSPNFSVQVYDSAGVAVGSPVKIADSSTTYARPVATALPDGGFVVEYRTQDAAGTAGTYQVVFGPAGALTPSSTVGADTLTGNDKADTITGGGGADVIYAGGGDDKVILNTDNVTQLANAAATAMVVDGGTGVNTLQITNTAAGTGATLDLTSATVAAKVHGFSSIDITGPTSTATANTLKLDYKAISTLSGATDNAATTTANESKMLVVNGDAGDKVQLVNGQNYVVSANQTAESLTTTFGSSYNFVAGHTYKSYTLNGATLFVDSTVTVDGLTSATAVTGTTTNTVMSNAVTVQSLFAASFSDSDAGQTFKGVAITSAGSSAQVSATGAHYEFSTDGTAWTALAGGLTDSTAVFLAPTTLVRYVEAAGKDTISPPSLVARLVDSSGQNNTSSLVSGNTVNASVNGGTTAFSAATVTATSAVAPVVLDLNHDGVLSYSQVQMDVLGTGHLQQTSWAGAQDGVLVWDKQGDGQVHDNSQYAFAQYGAAGSTDLQGLAAGFDSNHDGVLDAKDAKFAQFAVWQDANQDGVVEAGEMHKLLDAGVVSIHLTSDGVVRTPNASVVEAGHSTAQLADGSSMAVADAAFGVQALSYHVDSTVVDAPKLVLTGAGMDLNLSSFVAKHGAIAEVDVSGTGANSIKLSLADVLQSTPHATLKVTGDADDSVSLDASVWTNTGNTVAQGGHTYAVYNDAASHTAQLLIDQNLVNAGHVI